MNQPQTLTKHRLLGGATWIVLAEAMMLPTGFLTVLFLIRQLGPEKFGLFTLGSTITAWIEWGINSMFARTTIKFVGETDQWQPVATAVLRIQFGCSLLAAIALALLAPAIASLLNEPALAPLLWLFALEIPLFNLALAHQNILSGMRRFGPRALAGGMRWTARLGLIVILVNMGLSVHGAILGSIGAVLISLLVSRLFIQPSLWQTTHFPVHKLVGYALPLFLSAIALRFYEKLDLVMLKGMGGSVESVGFYAVAQNLALLGGVLSPALVSILLATLSQYLGQGEIQQLKTLSRTALRVVILHLPFATLASGSATEIVTALFGSEFTSAAPIFSILIFSAIALVMITVTSAILIASDQPQWTFALVVPLPVFALGAHWLLIPYFGSVGAALGTLLVALTGAIAGLVAVYIRWQILPPFLTIVRSSFVAGVVAILAAIWSTSSFLILLKLVVLSLAIVLMLCLLREVKSEDFDFIYPLFLKK